ncbi:hypothetical protein [Microbacterium sp. TNHR37B]|uniref:hypothetical protein n=1 Tax=Microbacterium sp. TNHR37B TaxID=1775956 RepID=UPI0012F8C401|nr:hypothetical protein [Microbacterium sp. TNHR37B]
MALGVLGLLLLTARLIAAVNDRDGLGVSAVEVLVAGLVVSAMFSAGVMWWAAGVPFRGMARLRALVGERTIVPLGVPREQRDAFTVLTGLEKPALYYFAVCDPHRIELWRGRKPRLVTSLESPQISFDIEYTSTYAATFPMLKITVAGRSAVVLVPDEGRQWFPHTLKEEPMRHLVDALNSLQREDA